MMLGASDAMEIKLRHLSATQHLWRTGDRNAFNRMLAVKPPGIGSDIAPTWMLDDAAKHSKTEYQRDLRTGRIRGRGRGRGRKGEGKGDGKDGGGGGGRVRGGRERSPQEVGAPPS